jgi:hypothetical protein
VGRTSLGLWDLIWEDDEWGPTGRAYQEQEWLVQRWGGQEDQVLSKTSDGMAGQS